MANLFIAMHTAPHEYLNRIYMMPKTSLDLVLVTCIAATLSTTVCAEDPTSPDELARLVGCFECHGATQDGIGPSFESIAKKYEDDDSARTSLLTVVKNGGKGNWTTKTRGVPMPPFSGRLTDIQIRGLVQWVLAQ